MQATDSLLDCPGLEFVVAQGVLRLLRSPALRSHPLSSATWHVLASVCTLCAKPTSAGAALLDGLEGLLAEGEGRRFRRDIVGCPKMCAHDRASAMLLYLCEPL